VARFSPPFELTPRQPTLVKPFHRPGWVYEEKVDGWRIVAYKAGGNVRLISRKSVEHTARFPHLVKAVASLPGMALVLDGEVAVFDQRLVSRFDLLGDPGSDAATTRPVYIAFDVLYARGRDLRARPLEERRNVLERLVDGADLIFPVRRLTGGDTKRGRKCSPVGSKGTWRKTRLPRICPAVRLDPGSSRRCATKAASSLVVSSSAPRGGASSWERFRKAASAIGVLSNSE
jgi:ATP dependent DNA ligase domain